MDEIFEFKRKEDDDFYFILGCDINSSEEQIATEYKARVLGCHPDKHPNDPSAHEEFSRLSRAKDVLLDPEKRRDYDRWKNSGVAIPYDRWKSMSRVKTSMHWGFRPQQPAIASDKTQTPQPSATAPSSSTLDAATAPSSSTPDAANTKSSPHTLPPMNFVRRENPQNNGWVSDSSNPMLQKFRNYEI